MNTYANKNVVATSDVEQNEFARSDIDQILDQEATRNTKETWSKLDKTTKINKLLKYAEKVGGEKEFTDEDIGILSKYLAASLERKRLLSVKDVVYDNVSGEINNIPSLVFSSTSSRKYTLKRLEKRASTLKSLGTGRGKKKNDKIDMVMN